MSAEKNGLRIAAGTALVALLLLMASSNGFFRQEAPSEPRSLPIAVIDSSRMVQMREGTVSALVCLYRDGESPPDGRGGLLSLYWLSISGGDAEMVNIPSGTRMLVEDASGQFVYSTPEKAFWLGREETNPWRRMTQGAKALFCEVDTPYVAAMEAEAFIRAIDAMGGLFVRRDTFSLSAGGIEREDAPRGRSLLLSGRRVMQYISSDAGGTDVGALDRQNHVAAVFFETLFQREGGEEDVFAWLEECGGDGFYHDVGELEQKAIAEALAQKTPYARTLPGDERRIEDQSWLPNRGKIKEYILDRYYALPN